MYHVLTPVFEEGMAGGAEVSPCFPELVWFSFCPALFSLLRAHLAEEQLVAARGGRVFSVLRSPFYNRLQLLH